MTEEHARILLENYFEKNNLEFLSMRRVKNNGKIVSVIEFSCDKGIYYMELSEDLSLLCQNATRTGWIQIKNY